MITGVGVPLCDHPSACGAADYLSFAMTGTWSSLLSSAWKWSTAAGFWSIMGREVTSQYIGCFFFFGQFNCMNGLRQQCNVLCIFKISLLAFCVSILNNWSYLVVPFTFDGFLAHQQIFSSFFFMLNMVLPLVTNNSKYWNDNPQQKKADDKKKGDFIKKLSPHWSKHVILL